MASKDIFGLIIGFGGGIYCILASILNWEFFFNSKKANLFVTILGRNGARIFYGLLGACLVFLGIQILRTAK